MAIDMAKIKARYQNFKNNTNSSASDSNTWKPQEGEQTIRIAPTKDGDPFREYWLHYRIANEPLMCSKRNFGEKNPIMDFAYELWSEGTPSSKKMAKDLFSKQRFYSPVLVRGQEELGVRIWGYSKTVYEQLLSLILDPDYGDITDPNTGIDLVLTYGKPEGSDFFRTQLKPKRKSSPICSDGDEACAEMLENVPSLDDLYPRKTPEELKEYLDKYMEGLSSSEATEKEEISKFGTSPEQDKVSQAFDELLGE